MPDVTVLKLWQGVCNGKRVTRQDGYEAVVEAVIIYQQTNGDEEPIDIVYVGTLGKSR